MTTPGASVADSLVTLLNVGSQDDLNTTNETQAKSPFIRNCFVDGGVTTPRPAPTLGGPAYVRAISMAWCRGGVVEGNQIYGVDVGGPYAGGITYQTQLSIRDLIVRNNYYKNVARGPWLDLFFQGANLVLGGTAPTLTITGLVGVVSGANLGLATVLSGDRIWLQAGGSHDGMYQVRDVVVGTTSSFTITTVASTPTPVNVTTVKKLKSVTRAIFEGNVIELDVNNRTPKTKLIQGLNAVTSTKYGELETDVDDMFVLSFMQD